MWALALLVVTNHMRPALGMWFRAQCRSFGWDKATISKEVDLHLSKEWAYFPYSRLGREPRWMGFCRFLPHLRRPFFAPTESIGEKPNRRHRPLTPLADYVFS